ncbi:MAG TPA: FG-GAP-like repeat-containing protein [Terriglobales bacterium]
MKNIAIILSAILLGLVSVSSHAQAPVPFINLPLMPDAKAPGGPQFTLTVNGTGFGPTSIVNWNGNALQTQFITGSQLKAVVPAADIAVANTASVTVVNPAPGGGTSNVVPFSAARNEKSSLAFALEATPAVGTEPWSLAVGDFNGDGRPDLAISNRYDSTVTILLGDGKGNFPVSSTLAVANDPATVVVGDFNGDGKLDLAVASHFGNTLSILLGDGTGNFTLASSISVSDAYSVAVGDFNGDGNLDLAVTEAQGAFSNTLEILLGDGTGNFTPASVVAVGYNPVAMAVGDFNGDGKLDIAVANQCGGDYTCRSASTVSVLLGDGAGGFTLASTLPVGSSSVSIAAGDFNDDRKLDLAVGCSESDAVYIFLGDGKGKFTLASTPAFGGGPLALGDFNGDGKLDLAVENGYVGVSVLLGDGTGNFALGSAPWGGAFVTGMAAGDFNGDGRLDLATSDDSGEPGNVSILLQGIIPAAGLSPTSLSFGSQVVGTTSNPQPITLTNGGGKTLDITSITSSLNFPQSNNCPSTLPPNGQCTINVTFTPGKIGAFKRALTIRDNAPTSPQTVPLTGLGTLVTLSPSGLGFGNQQIGTTSPPQTATLINYGVNALTIHGIHITGGQARNFAQTNNCGTSVPAQSSCSINVTFTPLGKGSRSATLEVLDSDPSSPQTVALGGKGTM